MFVNYFPGVWHSHIQAQSNFRVCCCPWCGSQIWASNTLDNSRQWWGTHNMMRLEEKKVVSFSLHKNCKQCSKLEGVHLPQKKKHSLIRVLFHGRCGQGASTICGRNWTGSHGLNIGVEAAWSSSSELNVAYYLTIVWTISKLFYLVITYHMIFSLQIPPSYLLRYLALLQFGLQKR